VSSAPGVYGEGERTSKQWELMVYREDSSLVAAKNCPTENWRNISCSKRNHGECFLLVCRRKNIFVFISQYASPEYLNILSQYCVIFHNPCGHNFMGGCRYRSSLA
jgi:hypothetical protein